MGASLKQRNFVKAYLRTFSPSKAYREAYNPPTMSDKAITIEGCKMLKTETILNLLQETMKSEKPKPDDLNPEYIKAELKKAIDSTEVNDGARVAALNIASKVFGMQTMKTEDVTEKMLDTDLALTLACAHYQIPVQDFDELDDEDKIFYSEVMKRLNGTMN